MTNPTTTFRQVVILLVALQLISIVSFGNHTNTSCPYCVTPNPHSAHPPTHWIGLLTPPLGISCFVIKSTLNDDNISLKDVFMGALPFAFVMLIVLFILIEFPILSLALL